MFALERLSRHPVRFWLDAQLGEIFGVTVRPSAETADQIYDQIASCLASPEFKPRALYEKFKIEVLATTDDPCDDLAAHQFLRDDESWQRSSYPDLPTRQVPRACVSRPGTPMLTGWLRCPEIDTGDYDGYIAAMENRRQYFKDNGAVSADHSHSTPAPTRWRWLRRSASMRCAQQARSRRWRLPRYVAISSRRWPGWPVMTAW